MNLLSVKGVGEITLQKLHEIGIDSVEDLVYTFPKNYVDMDAVSYLYNCSDGDICAFSATLSEMGRAIQKGKMSVLHARFQSAGTAGKIIWYNQPYFAKTLTVGNQYRFYGKVKLDWDGLLFVNPQVDLIDGQKLVGIHPIYRTKGLLAQRTYASLVQEALPLCSIESVVPPSVERYFDLPPYREAFFALHHPASTDLHRETERITLEKIIKRICAFRLANEEKQGEGMRDFTEVDFTPVLENLPFTLSEDQENALRFMTEKLKSKQPLNAILCGDVGSGKTIVSLLLCYFVIRNGYKTALMAPTAILAKQHFYTVEKLFSPLGLICLFLDGSIKERDKTEVYGKLREGKFDILVGTHSLLNEGLQAENLGLIVTDEQHRFGVAQRTRLIGKGQGVAVLTMSATPIPRSMRLIAYGEVDYLTVQRKRLSHVKTRIVTKIKRGDMWQYVADICERGEQAYVVAPRIFDAEGIESESVEKIAEELKLYIAPEKTGVLHGKMVAEEKQKILDKFYRGEISLLVSTTVIEVGIDVANATTMVICDAEKFGLATLHQLRGRIGRGDKDGYCFLYTEREPSEGLKTLVNCADGFAIAERDFEQRGGGDIFGLEQSGTGTLTGITLPMIKKAKKIADWVDLHAVKDLLWEEINSFSLENVSLN